MALEAKQIRFCDEYLVDNNGTQAAIRAGYSPRTAKEQAARMLTKANVQEYLKSKQAVIANKLDISQERIFKELAAIAFSDIRAYYDENSLLKPISELNDAAAAALAGIEVDQLWAAGMDGKVQVGETKKIKRWDKIKAIETINKMLGYNAPEKTEGRVVNINTVDLTPEQAKAFNKAFEDEY